MKESPFCGEIPAIDKQNEGYIFFCGCDVDIIISPGLTHQTQKNIIDWWNTRPSPWIKVSERLPDDEKLYFVLRKSPNTGYSVEIAKYFHSRMIWLTGSKEIHYVAAWCPLPELPEDINSSISQEKENKESSVLTQKEIKEAARKAGIEL